jgi:hypothetical protein|tara:strand:+ start:292 stop:525 length:234 start_codon:yes stop_codon:yes gene_type:complete
MGERIITKEEWDNDPYYSIVDDVKKVAQMWGCELIGFNPGWTFSMVGNYYSVQIPHPIMLNILNSPAIQAMLMSINQ